jgi:branched-chain amino acid transport system substrate-binding protein
MMRKVVNTLLGMLIISAFMVSPSLAAYKIGAVFAATGPASALGDPEQKTAEMLVNEINAAGGINGEKLELVLYDTEADATKANLYVKKLINQDKVLAIIGPTASGTTLAVIPLVEQYKVPMISCAASYMIVHNEKTGKPYPWVFKTPQTDSMAAEAILAHIKGKGLKKIAILSVTEAFGASGRGELIRLAPQYGLEIVADEKYDPKDTDMTAQLTKIKGLAPQAIINWSVGPPQVTVMRNWRDLGMTAIPFYQSHGFGSRRNIELAAGAAEGVYCPLGAGSIPDLLPANHPQKAVTMAYQEKYRAKFNAPVSAFGGYAWDAMGILVNALKTAGADKAKLREAIEKTRNFVGQQGVYSFSADDHNGLTKDAFQMVMVKNNDWALAD